MTARFLIFVTSLLLFLVSCQSEPEKRTPAPPPVHTILFLDKSVSVTANDPYVKTKYEQALQQMVKDNMRRSGDRMDVYFLHENTAMAQAFSKTIQSAITAEDTLNASPTDVEAAKNDFALSLKKEQVALFNRCRELLAEANAGTSNRSTDIWASVDVIRKLVPTQSNETVYVYYLSDMVESMRGDQRRDFHTNPPKTREQATEWAQADVAKLKASDDADKLARLSISIALPFNPTSSTRENNPAVIQYWDELFRQLGAERGVQVLGN